MSHGKVKMIKQLPPEEMNLEGHEMAIKIRQKSTYTNDLDLLKEWVSSQPETVKDGLIVPTSKMFAMRPDPNKPTDQPLPPELRDFVSYLLEEYRIPENEVRACFFNVIKPMKQYSAEAKANSRDITIKQCLAHTSDRFVFFGGSRELLKYKIINIDQLKSAANLPTGSHIPKEFYEQVAQNSLIHMDLITAISNRLFVDGKNSYTRPNKPGFRSGYQINKNPDNRWIIILDLIATNEKFDNVLSEKLEMIGHIIGSKPNSKEAKAIQSFKPPVVKEADDEAPLLVELDTPIEKSTESYNSDDAEDIALDNL